MNKREGDGATPSGIHRITQLWYRSDRLVRPAAYARSITFTDLWCDDKYHPAYNHHIRRPFSANCEKLHRADPLYDIIMVTDWNWPGAIPGKGSAIFLHQWRRPGFATAGCIAMSRRDLIWLATNAPLGTKLIVPPLIAKYTGRRASMAETDI